MTYRRVFSLIWLLCCGFLVYAFYLQHYKNISPCPLCVLQRYGYIAIAVFCLLGRFLPWTRLFSLLSLLTSVGGAFAASLQLWAIRHPAIICGRDPLETMVNGWFTARWFPSYFRAEGLCGERLQPIFGLTPPEWSLGWFAVFAFCFFFILLRGSK